MWKKWFFESQDWNSNVRALNLQGEAKQAEGLFLEES